MGEVEGGAMSDEEGSARGMLPGPGDEDGEEGAGAGAAAPAADITAAGMGPETADGAEGLAADRKVWTVERRNTVYRFLRYVEFSPADLDGWGHATWVKTVRDRRGGAPAGPASPGAAIVMDDEVFEATRGGRGKYSARTLRRV